MYNLSKPQKLIYNMEKYAGDSVAVICGSMIVKGTKNLPELQYAVNELYRLNDAFRMRIIETSTGVQQVVEEFIPCSPEILHFECKDDLDLCGDSWAKEPMDLYGSLCEIKPILLSDSYGILVKLHHIISDAWTLSLLATQFNAILSGETPAAYSYIEYLDREKTYIQSSRCAKDKGFFLEQFKECDEVTYLSEKQNNSLRSKRKTFVIEGTQAQGIIAYTKEHGASPYVLFMTVLATYMSRTRMNVERFYIGTAVLNRSGVQEKSTAGMFINTVPLLMQLDSSLSFVENLAKVKKASFAIFRHQKFNYGDILSALRQEYDFEEKLYDVVLNYQNATIVGEADGMESTWYHSGTQMESLQIHIDDRDREGVFRIHFDYQTEKFSEKEIERIYGHICTLLFDAIENGDKKLFELELLSPEEKRQLLYDFNHTAVDYPKDKCVHTLFEERVEKTPDKIVVIACDQTLTYRKLNEQANRIAHGLIAVGVKPGDIVAFALPRRSYLIAAILGILKAGGAYLPIDPDYPQDRIDFMLEDSRAAYFITEANVQELLENVDTTQLPVGITGDNLCYCIYTSGTTGNPKGTLIRHRNLVNFCTNCVQNNLQHYIAQSCNRILACGAIVFDISIFEIMLSLVLGKSVVFASEVEIYDGASLGRLITKHQIDCIHCTPTKLRTYFDSPEFIAACASVRCIMVGGELLTEDVYALIQQHSQATVFNGYGPTETTMGVSFGDVRSDGIVIGKPIANTQIYIVDKYIRPIPIGVTGELCIAGDGVGAGYLNHPELTAEKFIDNHFGVGKLYKTGDLAYWREDGNIVYVGRNDFQVKIRGLRIELGEIESVLQEVEGISQAVVVVRKNEAGHQLICAFYTGCETDGKALRSIIGQKLPKYMLPHVFAYLKAIPLTASGKVNRKALPEIDLSDIATEVEYIAPVTNQEIVVANAVQTVLHIERAGIKDNFFDLGGDSLKAIELSAALERTHYHASVKTIFAAETLGELAERLTTVEVEQETELPIGPIPATDAQIRVYTAQAMTGGTAYNVPYAFRVKQLDSAKLQVAVSELVARHESLRTRFENRNGQIIQVVENLVNCTVEALDSEDTSTFIRPFDLETAPLLRVGYYQNTVMVDMHHIISDGGSMPVFLRELNELYMGRNLDKKPAQYREYAVQDHDCAQSEQYWLSVYADEPPVLEMNTDHPRQSKQTFSGAVLYETLPKSLHAQICEECRTMGITPYAFYIGAYYVLLSKFSGNEDIVVGVPASGRSGKFLDSIGMFVNTLALRGRPEGSKTTLAFFKEIKETTIQALDNQNYPYGDLVKKLGIHTESRNPLFDVMFAYQSEEMTEAVFGDEPAELLPIPVATSKYDFTFNIMPRQDAVVLMAEYCVDLYEERTIRRLLVGYKLILTQMLDSEKQLRDISVVTNSERQRLLYDFNDTAADYPRDKCVHTLFEEQAAKTPDKTAVIACDCTLTYRKLNEQANQIAHSLINQGVKPGDIVAFALPRRSYLIAAMFGILKAGTAYLPIDPDYPQDRIEYMLEDSKAAYFITESNIQELLNNENVTDPMIAMASDSLCYCIYTSGSTGKPKGTLLTHKNVGNYINNCNKNVIHSVIQDSYKAIVSVTTVGFDIFVTESILPLTNGMTIIFANEEQAKIQSALNSFLECNPADVLQTTPTKMRTIIADSTKCEYLMSLKAIILGGEVVDAIIISNLNKLTSAHIFNIYGPTETTVWSTKTEILSTNDITIGKPIANTKIYIVDKYLRPVPIGVTGELCIAGDGVGAGYLNRPDLTAEKFIDNPFGEGKLYKTGDLAFWREDGNIVYVGRNDFQVKIRGLRIELGEIENALQGVEGISQAVAVVRKSEDGRQLVCAFYTGQNMDSKILRTAIGQKLPKYMLPHSFAHLEAMPLTTSGKVNRKALPEVDLSSFASTAEYIPPVGEIEKRLATFMEQTLNYSPVGRDDDFFDLGGDSLKAIEFLSKAHSNGLYFSLQNVFDYPTIRQLHLCMEEGDKLKISYENVDFSQINELLAKNRLGEAVPPEQDVGSILLTGATGFLGIHILADYLEHDSGMAYCLVRGQTQAESKKRLVELLNFYFGDKYADLIDSRIQVLCGDLQKDSMGLDSQEYKMLLENVGTVINAAASVKHYGSYQYFYEVNVDTVGRLIAFCRSGHAKLVHISTLSVSGNSFGDDFSGYISETEKHFYESDLYIGQPLENVYARSKFEAEKLVLEAALNGLPVHIMRMGNLTNRQSDGVFQINYQTNAAAQRIKGIVELGIVPDYLINEDMYVEFTPIDEAAQAIMLLIRHFDLERTVFHINSTKVVYLDKLMGYFTELGYPLRTVPGDEFTTVLRETAKQARMEHIFETFINDLDDQDHLNYDSNIRIKNAYTEEHLCRLGFVWSKIGLEYLRKYTEYFEKIGYWEAYGEESE